MKYNWQYAKWPEFNYSTTGLQQELLLFSEKVGRVDGMLSALSGPTQMETVVDLMVSEALKSSEIEGEMLSRTDVLSSIKNNLGMVSLPKQVVDLRARGMADLMVNVRESYDKPLTKKALLEWHTMLMMGTPRIRSGAWRKHAEPMRVVSGTLGQELVHYEAPPSSQVPGEMKRFIQWFNSTAHGGLEQMGFAPLRSAVVHLYFESIHPFEDGNGRIGRALSEKAISQGVGRPVLVGLSSAIESDRAGYYAALKQAQRSTDISEWVAWFVHMLLKAMEQVEVKVEFTLKKISLLDRMESQLNSRQLKVLRRMLKEGPEGFSGGMTAKKYRVIAKTSKPSATRDLQDLVSKKVLIPTGGGRSTNYQVNI